MESMDWNRWKNLSDRQIAEIQARIEAERKLSDEEIGNTPEKLALWRLVKNTGLSGADLQAKKLEFFEVNDNNKKAYEKIQQWTPEKRTGFFLWGSVGTGKTHLLKGFCIKQAKLGLVSRFVSTISVMDEIRDSIKNCNVAATINKLCEFDILALDDFGAEQPTPFVQEKFLSILETRLSIAKATFISSNLSSEQMKERYDIRILDRLKELVEFIKVPGDSYRDKKYQQNKGK